MSGALDGIRVLELPGARTQFASMLLAGMGAEVWMAEPAQGSPLRRIGPQASASPSADCGLPFLAHHSNKKSFLLDITTPEGRATFRNLATGFDVVIEAESPATWDNLDIGPASSRAENPGLIWLSISPYGSTGRHSGYLGSDLSAQAMGGAMSTTGEPNGRVYRAGGGVGDKMAGYTAAAALLVAILVREHTGQGQHVDVSAQEAVAGQMERGALFYEFTGVEPERGGRLYPTAAFPCGLFPARDGWISLVALQLHHWEALVDWIGDPRLRVERFKIGSERALARDEIDKIICDWSRTRAKRELSTEGQRRRIAIAELQTALEVTRDEHLLAVNFYRELERADFGKFQIPGAPFNASLTPFTMKTAAPRIGEHNGDLAKATGGATAISLPPTSQFGSSRVRLAQAAQAPFGSELPLSRYRVLDLSWVIAGPACTRFLADQGAEVIKIESTSAGDPVRTFGPWLDGKNTAPEGGAAFALLNRNKRSVTLDLKQPEGVRLLLELVKQSDVVVDNFTAGTMDKLGLGYSQLLRANPAIVMAQISGFGQTGPYAHRVAYGQTLLALTGHYDQIGDPDSPPLMPGYTYTDQAAGMIASFAILSALRHRERTGAGQHLDLSLFQMGSALMSEVLLEALVNETECKRTGNSDRNAISHGVYRCKGNDSWCIVATWNEVQWGNLVSQVCRDLPEIETQLSSRWEKSNHEIDVLIERWTSLWTAVDVMERLQKVGIEAAVVQGAKELLEDDAHLRERGFFQPFTHWPSGKTLLTEGIPYELSSFPRTIRQGPPVLGEANDYVFHELLELSGAEIEKLKASGVIGCR